MKNRTKWLRTTLLAVAALAAPTFASAANPLYPPGIGFNPNVDYTQFNYAQSPNIRKFMDRLPGLGASGCAKSSPAGSGSCNENDLGQYIPVALPDTVSYPGADYYELGIKQFTQKVNTDLPPTTFRGYYQKNGTDSSSQYLGPAIIAKRNRPVRVKYFNELPTGLAGNLFLPVDTTIMGAGMGPTTGVNFTQNRANVHLHGGRSPWISDGTPHQWITPAGDGNAALGGSAYQKGLSFQNVPDMVNGSTVNGVAVPCIGGAKCFTPALSDGIGTLFWTNDQSSRLMFFHDHAYGITRLNVYAGLAAPYLLTSQVEDDLISGTNLSGGNPAGKQILPDQGTPNGVYRYGIPLVIQDKSFVNDATTPTPPGFPAASSGYVPTTPTATSDPLWNRYVLPNMPGGSLWLAHEYLPIENIFDPTGQMWNGRWDYGPFLNPPMVPQNTTLPSPTITPESFMDTMTVNGTAYPYIELPPQAIRFRILSVGNDRSLNLSWFKADPLRINVTNGGSNYSANPTVTISGNAGTYTSAQAIVSPGTIGSINVVGAMHYITPPTVTLTGGGGTCTSIVANIPSNSSGLLEVTANGCTGFTSAPTVNITGGSGGTYTSASATIIPKGVITAIVVNGAAGYRSDMAAPTVTITDATGTGASAVAFVNTELKMVPAAYGTSDPNYPSWPGDGRDGGVPDPATAGPSWVQIGNESGFLAQAAVWPPNPVVYEQSRQNIPTLGVTYHSLLLMPAMRADVVVDFSQYKDGDTLILYNDAPAPMPGFWPLNDYYTDDPDQTAVGGAPTTPAGFGPNTRTVMQVRIRGSKTSSFNFDLPTLQAALPHAFAADQDKPLVPQMAYNAAYPGFATFDTYAQNKDNTLNLTGVGQPISRVLTTAPGNGYTTPPTVTILAKDATGSGATATAGLNPMGGITLLTAGAGYTAPPVVTIGTPASTYTAPATPPAGTTPVTATAVATISGGGVTALSINEPGSYYNTNTADLKAVPTCTIAPPTGCTINTTTCVAATCSTFIAAANTVGSITLTNPGTNYTSEPLVYITGGGGTGAGATALLKGALVFTGKNITEGFDPDFGRLDIRLGSTPNPLTPNVGNGQVIGIARYIDPPTEMLNDGEVILWRIAHLGVDSHSLHFHLFDMQVVNHVDYTNVVKPPYPDELGWREVIRTNPMEDIIVAIKPRSMALPFPIPPSNRLLDTTNAVNVNTNFLPIAPPAGVAAVPQVTNSVTNFGGEYVWHCHLLAHEENDMMRPMVLLLATAVPPAPTLASAVAAPEQVTLTWSMPATTFSNVQNSFAIQRRLGTTGAFATIATLNDRTATTYTDTTVTSATAYGYRIQAMNAWGSSAFSTTRNATTPTFNVPTVSVSAPNGSIYGTGSTIALAATATAGGTATVSKVDFYYGTTNLIGTATTSPYTVNWATVPAGSYSITAKVTNSQGATAVSAPISVTVTQLQPITTVSIASVSPASPSLPGASVTFTPVASGGVGTPQYQLWVLNPVTATWTSSAYGPTTVWNTTGLPNGTYNIQIWARNVGSTANWEAFTTTTYTLGAAVTPVASVSISATTPASPAAVGTASVTFTPVASGGSGTPEYQLWVYNPATASWSSSAYGPTTIWNTSALPAGIYNIQIWARNVGSTANYEAFTTTTYTLAAAGVTPVASVSISSVTPASPQPAATTASVTFTPVASGGSGTPEYQLWVYNPNTVSWSSSAYGPTTVWNTTGLQPGTYNIQIWSRNVGSTAGYEAFTTTQYVLQ